MRFMRAFRTNTAASVIAWKLSTLALLPVAFCCQAMLAAGDACCDGTHEGAYCPLDEAPRSGDPNGRQLQPCESFDDALIGLLSLTGFTPEAPEPQAVLVAGQSVAAASSSPLFLDRAPPLPPPRA